MAGKPLLSVNGKQILTPYRPCRQGVSFHVPSTLRLGASRDTADCAPAEWWGSLASVPYRRWVPRVRSRRVSSPISAPAM